MGPLEIILILLVVALIFGARKLPELGKGLGQGIKEFKKETHDPASPTHTTPVTDVQARPLDPVTTARPEGPRVVEMPADRDHRA
ncbi:Sec-independent protein translocase protein TatA [Deinococcus aetherius]|uniref:Sec-independent protein translocase protein TatA n=1 Tax=Deinococcus aetherius TaxID=200252 RepID=A0ABM8AF64_9DEIO|nr:twin-arginine translocase TatA/TatE family subunit [Deinococcus aetherius]BDP42429.1 Sec-independent protein translocase protein TatA [Deinococcus aetherius]